MHMDVHIHSYVYNSCATQLLSLAGGSGQQFEGGRGYGTISVCMRWCVYSRVAPPNGSSYPLRQLRQDSSSQGVSKWKFLTVVYSYNGLCSMYMRILFSLFPWGAVRPLGYEINQLHVHFQHSGHCWHQNPKECHIHRLCEPTGKQAQVLAFMYIASRTPIGSEYVDIHLYTGSK